MTPGCWGPFQKLSLEVAIMVDFPSGENMKSLMLASGVLIVLVTSTQVHPSRQVFHSDGRI